MDFVFQQNIYKKNCLRKNTSIMFQIPKWKKKLPKKEKRLKMEEKSNTELESQLGRGFRKKKNSHYISKENDNSSNSSKNETSDNDSILELNNSLYEQDDGINQNIGDNDSHILNINETVVIEAEDNVTPTKDGIISAGNHTTETLDPILQYVREIKLMCKRMDERLHVLENNGNNKNTHRNIDMLPQLPMDCFEDINNFEIILASEEAQSQLVNMLIMTGGTTVKDAIKRALQKLFTNNLASKCSWTEANNNFKLKDLKMIMCMKNAIKNICPTVTEAKFEGILKAWFRQANLRLNGKNVRTLVEIILE